LPNWRLPGWIESPDDLILAVALLAFRFASRKPVVDVLLQPQFEDHSRRRWEHQRYSEHAQCLAVLSVVVSGPTAIELMGKMLQTSRLAQSTIYFSHYLFEAFGQTGRIDALIKRLEAWQTSPAHSASAAHRKS
jgi:hypothetical protein